MADEKEAKASFPKGASLSETDVKDSEPSEESASSATSIDDSVSINEKRVSEVMAAIRKNHYSSVNNKDDAGFERDCQYLFKKDYEVVMVSNKGGSLCHNYPLELIIPVGERSKDERETFDFIHDQYVLLANQTGMVRSRSRFVVPVIFCDNKFICRSGTVGNTATSVYENIKRQTLPKTAQGPESMYEIGQRIVGTLTSGLLQPYLLEATRMLWAGPQMTELLLKDAELLAYLKVERICDLMVENEKLAVKRLLSSSGEINLDVYSGFKVEQMPFPGLRYFKAYYNAARNPEGLGFNWDAHDADVELKLSEAVKTSLPDVDWNKFKEWEVTDLVRTYLKVILTFIARDTGGLLVHCISGWDRTPLFISLIRVSLWADGVIHKSLDAVEMAFLTLTYDWYLFGHAFPVRYMKREEVMHFCFNFPLYMRDDEFSVTRIFHALSPEQKKNRNFPDFNSGERRKKLIEIRSILLRSYAEEILDKPEMKVSEEMVRGAAEITSVLEESS